MADSLTFSFEELMDLTVLDVPHGGLSISIKDQPDLSQEQQEACLSKLRALTKRGFDLALLNTKLKQIPIEPIPSSPSPSSTPASTPPAEREEDQKRRLEMEKKSSESLIKAHGQPCYPIELAPGIYQDCGPYREIMSYWHGTYSYSLPITKQLERWNEFRRKQQRIRRRFVHQNRFSEYQKGVSDRRRRHGLDGDVQLEEDRDKQSDLDHWMEYQNYELQKFERLETRLKDAEAELIARRKALAESTFTGEEGYSMERLPLAKLKLQVAESRLQVAQSDSLQDVVKSGAWVRWFQEQVNAKTAHWEALPEWRWGDWLPGGKSYIQEGKTEMERKLKNHAAYRKIIDAEAEARSALKLATEGLKAAEADNFGEEIEKGVLAEMASTEVQSAREKFEAETEREDHHQLKINVARKEELIAGVKAMIEHLARLLKWIEQKRCEMEDGYVSIEGVDKSKQVSSRVLRARHKAGNSAPNGSSKTDNSRKRPFTEASNLQSADGSESSEPNEPTVKRRCPRKNSTIFNRTQQPSKTATTPPTSYNTMENEEPKPKTFDRALKSCRSSKVSKSEAKGNLRKLTEGKESHNNNGPVPSLSVPTLKERTRALNGVPLRRSKRITRPPERFSPG